MDWSYIAGYFDGEGHVNFRARPSRPGYVVTGLAWTNTHLESLAAMRAFMGCGTISRGRRFERGLHYIYALEVRRCEDVVRVGEQILPHLIIKRQRVAEMLTFVREHRRPAPEGWGRLTALGVGEVRRLYWTEGMTQQQIGEHVGVHRNAVAVFMGRHGIEGRPRGPRPKLQHARRSHPSK